MIIGIIARRIQDVDNYLKRTLKGKFRVKHLSGTFVDENSNTYIHIGENKFLNGIRFDKIIDLDDTRRYLMSRVDDTSNFIYSIGGLEFVIKKNPPSKE